MYLAGKKTYHCIDGEWTVTPGQTLFLKKGATIIRQFFDEDFCMLGLFISNDMIVETIADLKGKISFRNSEPMNSFVARQVQSSNYLDGYFDSMLTYFRAEDKPHTKIVRLKLKEFLINIVSSDHIPRPFRISWSPTIAST